MNVIMALTVLVFLGGIIYLNVSSNSGKKTREQYLRELTDFLEGELSPVEDDSGIRCYLIKFRYRGEDFIYEDIEDQGFRDKVYKAHLRAQTPSSLTLTFTEKKKETRIRSNIFLASEISTHYVNEHVQLLVPKYLKDMNTTTNDPAAANKLFEDKKVVSILKRFKNVDNRGSHFLTIGIVKGEVILEFRSMKTCHPNIFDLRSDIPSIDDFLEKMLALIHKLKEDI